jgi:hypothetical protein
MDENYPMSFVPLRDGPDVSQLVDFMHATEIRIRVLCSIGPHLRLVTAPPDAKEPR